MGLFSVIEYPYGSFIGEYWMMDEREDGWLLGIGMEWMAGSGLLVYYYVEIRCFKCCMVRLVCLIGHWKWAAEKMMKKRGIRTGTRIMRRFPFPALHLIPFGDFPPLVHVPLPLLYYYCVSFRRHNTVYARH